MRGINRLTISGNIGGNFTFGDTNSGVPACSFFLVSDRPTARNTISVWVKVNVYGDLALVCEDRLKKGGYAIVDGELMNRSLPVGELVEVRAHEIIFLTLARAQSLESQDLKDQEQTNGQLDAPHRD